MLLSSNGPDIKSVCCIRNQ